MANRALRLIPDRVFQMPQLRVLSLQNNIITALPSRFGALRQVATLGTTNLIFRLRHKINMMRMLFCLVWFVFVLFVLIYNAVARVATLV